jgi:hypothetical protein
MKMQPVGHFVWQQEEFNLGESCFPGFSCNAFKQKDLLGASVSFGRVGRSAVVLVGPDSTQEEPAGGILRRFAWQARPSDFENRSGKMNEALVVEMSR